MALKKNKARIAVLVSGSGTNLQAILDAQSNGIIKSGEVVLVVSNNPSAYAVKRAISASVECAVISKEDCTDRREFEEKLARRLKESSIDLIVLAGFMLILSGEFVSLFEGQIINVHPSLIPSFCGPGFYGLRVHSAALEKGVKVTGATVHFVSEIPDSGEIIMQKAVKVLEGDSPETLQKRVMRLAEWKILPLATEKLCADIISKEK